METIYNEIWKSIPGYEGLYEASNEGRVKSLERVVVRLNGRQMPVPEKILSPVIDADGYFHVGLSKDRRRKMYKINQLIAMAFLGHTPSGLKLVINHKNFIKTDNRVDNLEIVTHRVNCNKKHLKHSSIFTGVCWSKQQSKWHSRIVANNKQIHLGYFNTEEEASIAYQNALMLVNSGVEIKRKREKIVA